LPGTAVIHSEQRRLQAINRFSYCVAGVTLLYAAALFLLSLPAQGAAMACIAAGMLASVALSKHERYAAARALVLLSTSVGIAYLTLLLGLSSGVHLYLFAAALVCYLLYSLEARAKILLAFAFYVLTFVAALFALRLSLVQPLPLAENTLRWCYAFNFSCSLLLCLALIGYFAFTHNAHIKKLVDANRLLTEKHEQLQREINGRADAQQAVRAAVAERDKLLQEVHHRVKNNLAVISGLVELQNFYTRDEKASAILQQSRNRIKSIAVLHEKLYENKNLDRIDVKGYVDELLYFLRLTFGNQGKEIHIDTRIEPLELGLTEALPFSLLLNELLTNSYKHAFRDNEQGTIHISVVRDGQGEVLVSYRDNGCGFDYAAFPRDQSLGLNLIDTFCRQLKGQMQFVSRAGEGTNFTLKFTA
jgi:two-component sensor histidine kinase